MKLIINRLLVGFGIFCCSSVCLSTTVDTSFSSAQLERATFTYQLPSPFGETRIIIEMLGDRPKAIQMEFESKKLMVPDRDLQLFWNFNTSPEVTFYRFEDSNSILGVEVIFRYGSPEELSMPKSYCGTKKCGGPENVFPVVIVSVDAKMTVKHRICRPKDYDSYYDCVGKINQGQALSIALYLATHKDLYRRRIAEDLTEFMGQHVVDIWKDHMEQEGSQ